MMKAKVFDVSGTAVKEITLPTIFSTIIRRDLISKVLETKARIQPHSTSPVAGKQHSVSDNVRHRRHVWKSGYGKGASRVPRKQHSRRGSQISLIAAQTPNARGGRRAHPSKVIGMINDKKINKQELALALISAFSATAQKKSVAKKYASITEKNLPELPIIISQKVLDQSVKTLLATLKKIMNKEVYNLAVPTRSLRAGKGKRRGRKYKKSSGALFVIGKNEKIKTSIFDVVQSSQASVLDLARGGEGRITIYSEQAIQELGEKFKK